MIHLHEHFHSKWRNYAHSAFLHCIIFKPLEAKQACETMGSAWLGVGLIGWSITLPRNRIGGQKFLKDNQVLGKGETWSDQRFVDQDQKIWELVLLALARIMPAAFWCINLLKWAANGRPAAPCKTVTNSEIPSGTMTLWGIGRMTFSNILCMPALWQTGIGPLRLPFHKSIWGRQEARNLFTGFWDFAHLARSPGRSSWFLVGSVFADWEGSAWWHSSYVMSDMAAVILSLPERKQYGGAKSKWSKPRGKRRVSLLAAYCNEVTPWW